MVMEDDDVQQLCESCQQLDIDKLFSDPHSTSKYSATLENNSFCSFCRMIAIHHSVHRDQSRTNDIEFQVFAQAARGALELESYDDNAVDSSREANYLRVTWPLKDNKGCLSTTPGTFLALASEDAPSSRTCLNQRIITSRVDYLLLQDWLSKCQRNHDTCNHLELTSNPPSDKFKLVDVQSGDICPAPQGAPYVCLSYVWGQKRRFSVLPDAQIPTVLPKTIQDAISVTKELGLRYLWVDALCIDQSDPEEVVVQVKSMSNVYRGAYLTIVAVSNTNSDDGLPGVSSNRSTSEYQTSATLHGKRVIISDIIRTPEPFVRSLWSQRGWTMQEGLFAPRCLCFTECEVFLWCREHVFRESIAETLESFNALPVHHQWGRPKPPMQISIDGRWEFETYAKLINIYTRRQFSFETDVLNAFGGTIAYFEKISGTRFHFGLPEDNFIAALLWTPEREGQRRKLPNTLVPTWSWAAWRNASYYYVVIYTEEGDIKVKYRFDSEQMSSVQQLSVTKIIFPTEHDSLPHIITIDTQVVRFRLQKNSPDRSDDQKQRGFLWSLHSLQGKLIENRLGPRELHTSLAQLPESVQEELLNGDIDMILLVRWKGLRTSARKDDHDDDYVFGLLIRRICDAAERIALVKIRGYQWDEAEKTNEKVRLT